MEKVFVVVSDIKDKIGPLRKKLNMSKSRKEKESLTQQIETAEKELEKANKTALTEIMKAYELFCVYFVGKDRTQWTWFDPGWFTLGQMLVFLVLNLQ